MSYTVLFTADKERQLGVSKVFNNAWLYGPFIYDVLWPKYGEHFSLVDEMHHKNDWDGLENKLFSANNFEDLCVYFSMGCGFFHVKDKEKVGNAIIGFAKNNTFDNEAVKNRMIEVGNAMKNINDEKTEVFGLCLNTISNYVADSFNTSYETFLEHAKKEYPDDDEEFYEYYFSEMQDEFEGRKMFDDDMDYGPLLMIHIDDNNNVSYEKLGEYYTRVKNNNLQKKI